MPTHTLTISPEPRQFSTYDLDAFEGRYHFEASMISACRGHRAFRECENNHDVERVLRKARVLYPQSRTDTESCALVVSFSSRTSGEKFIARLNLFLREEA